MRAVQDQQTAASDPQQDHVPPGPDAQAVRGQGDIAAQRISAQEIEGWSDVYAGEDAAFSQAAHRVHADWDQLSAEQRADALLKAANDALVKTGAPQVPWAFGDTGGATAMFNGGLWQVELLRESFDCAKPTQAMMGMIVSIVFHEVRHAEQFFDVLRLLAGSGKGLSTLPEEARTPAVESILKLAGAQPLSESSTLGQNAAAWEHAFFDPESQKIERAAMKINADHKAELDAAIKIITTSKSAAQRDAALARIKPLVDAMKAYMSLANEADAYQTGNNAGEAYMGEKDPAAKKTR
jgi:hypothetical protein